MMVSHDVALSPLHSGAHRPYVSDILRVRVVSTLRSLAARFTSRCAAFARGRRHLDRGGE